MPFQPVPYAAMAVIHGRVDEQEVLNTLGWRLRLDEVVTDIRVTELATAVGVFWLGNIVDILPEDYQLEKVTVQALDAADGQQAEWTPASVVLGQLVGDTMPNNDTLAIAFRTGRAGRTNRGRNYWPLFLRDEVVKNRVTLLKAQAIVGAYSLMLDSVAFNANWIWSIISRKPIDVAGAGRAVPITNVAVNDAIVDSQRRRLPGRGR